MLFVFLRRLSTTLVSVVCIPFSLLVTCGVLWAEGSTLNTLTLLGLIVGIGMLVDNAVVVIENISRHQELGRDRKTSARLGSREVSVAVIAATLTSVIVFLPVIFNKPSEMNIRLKAIGITVCLALLSSLFISQTLIPLATSWFIKSKRRPRERWMVWLESRYKRLLGGDRASLGRAPEAARLQLLERSPRDDPDLPEGRPGDREEPRDRPSAAAGDPSGDRGGPTRGQREAPILAP